MKHSVIGTYEGKIPEEEAKMLKRSASIILVFLENGKFESYQNGWKLAEGSWKIVKKEVFAKGENSSLVFFRMF